MNKGDCICGNSASKFCGKCMVTKYCGKDCQIKDWTRHRKVCESLKQAKLEENYINSLNPTERTCYLEKYLLKETPIVDIQTTGNEKGDILKIYRSKVKLPEGCNLYEEGIWCIVCGNDIDDDDDNDSAHYRLPFSDIKFESNLTGLPDLEPYYTCNRCYNKWDKYWPDVFVFELEYPHYDIDEEKTYYKVLFSKKPCEGNCLNPRPVPY